MLKCSSFSIEYRGFFYSICPYTGNLIQNKNRDKRNENKRLPMKVIHALSICDNPYKCVYPQESELISIPSVFEKINNYHKTLLRISNKRFFLTKLYAQAGKPLFRNTTETFTYISQIQEQKESREKLCLQRAFLAMKTSKSFKRNGVLFIGAALPTGNMHAWIIEYGKQPDILDRDWIMYKPLLAFYYN